MTKEEGEIIVLNRGGYLVNTPIGYVQFGSPPETIKDTMNFPDNVPTIFVLPQRLFNWVKGISIADIEFPIYYNFFIKKQKTYIICQKDQFSRMKKVLQESLFGPQSFDIINDFASNVDKETIPDIKSEMDYFRNDLKFSDVLAFGVFENEKFTLQGLTITIDENCNFRLNYEDQEIAEVPGEIEYKPFYLIGERLPEPYRPPLFGVTCLGPSHGFDPQENTSGFIVWLNHNGIMVDPPVNSTEWLEDSNVSPKFIDSIILTHCHADHDAGTFQKILEEGKIRIYTTETVMMSFLRKYSSLTDVSIPYLMKLFDFHPIKIGNPVFIHGARFDLFYTLHSIPTIGFKMEFQDQTFVYSSDHNNDPKIHNDLFEKKIINNHRLEELRDFKWESKVIYHEAGIAPLHTPVDYLNSLPHDIQKKTVVYHIAKKDFPKKTKLTLATFGIENTLYFKTKVPDFERSYQIIGILKSLDFTRDLPIEKAQEFLDIVEEERFKKGKIIIHKGTPGDKFYIIYSGNVSVDSGGLENKKIYGPYDYFGEVALMTEQTRAANVIAETDIIAYTIPRDKFLNFITGTEFEKILLRLVKIRTSETWNLLSQSTFFQICTSSQKTWLESIFHPLEINNPGVIIEEGQEFNCIFIIRNGEVEVTQKGKLIKKLGKGDFIGSMQKIHKHETADHTFKNTTSVSIFAMKSEDIIHFVENNPGMLMKSDTEF